MMAEAARTPLNHHPSCSEHLANIGRSRAHAPLRRGDTQGGEMIHELRQVDCPLPLAPLHHLSVLEEHDGGQAVHL